jgi:hypothetical protein
MTDERYHAYRQVISALATDGAAALTATERDLLCDAAEGYLLMRSPDEDQAAELTANVAAVLGGLVDSSRWRDETAAAVQNAIEACGPRLEPVAA